MNTRTLWVDPDQMISLEENPDSGECFLDVVAGKEMYVKRLRLSAEETLRLKSDQRAARALAEAVRRDESIYQDRIEVKA